MVFFYTSAVFILYIILMLWLSKIMYSLGLSSNVRAQNFRNKILMQQKEAGTVKLVVSYSISGALVSFLLSIVYFLIAFFIYTVMWSQVCF